MAFRAGRIEKTWTGYVRIGGERLRLFILLGLIIGVATGAVWIYFSTWGTGSQHLLEYANVSFKASVGSAEPAAVEISGKVYRGDAERIREWMQEHWYGGRSIGDLARETLYAGLSGAVIAILLILYWSTRTSLDGDDETVRGPRLYRPQDLNRELKAEARKRGDAMGLEIGEVQIDKRAEASHLLLLGDSGAGKSSMIRLLLGQIRANGEAAIVYDPEREFLADFFIPGLDTILNPLDERSPYWSPWEEVHQPADMESLAMSFVPEPPQDGGNAKFWIESARTLFVALLEQLPLRGDRNPHSISRSLNSPLEQLEQLISDTPAANAVNSAAPQQAQGVLATLGIAARSLKLLRPASPGVPRFSAFEWSRKPKGWVFLCSTEQHRKATLPLVSVWIDCLIRPLLDGSLEEGKVTPVWLVADELHTLQRLATLPDILTRGRKFGLRSIVGTQSMAQFQSLYGNDSKTLLSQPKTKLIYRCSEPETAKWSSDLIGQVERITHRSSMSVSGKESFSLSDERRIDPLILPSEIQKMPDLTCFMIHAGKVTQLRMPIVHRLHRYEGFVARKDDAALEAEAVALTAA